LSVQFSAPLVTVDSIPPFAPSSSYILVTSVPSSPVIVSSSAVPSSVPRSSIVHIPSSTAVVVPSSDVSSSVSSAVPASVVSSTPRFFLE